jgi:isopentenyl diphosphate isomerase/L-lactate dehydrogenase-like FMN-dependent dehydrogenase
MDSSKVSATQHVSLADVLGRNPRIQIFSSLIRDVDSVSQRLADESQSSIILTPDNHAMGKMSRKPWESAEDYNMLGAEAYSGDVGQKRADDNLKRFTENHIVPVKTWKDGEKVQTMSGKTLWLEKQGDELMVCP